MGVFAMSKIFKKIKKKKTKFVDFKKGQITYIDK